METRTATAAYVDLFPRPKAPYAPARWLATVRRDGQELVRFWPVVQNMVVMDLRVRYHRSMLGFFWTLLNPILMMTTLTVVFSQLMNSAWNTYAVFLFAGQVPWILMHSSLTDCSQCIIANENLIRKIYLPKLIFPLARVLINLSTFLLSLGALFLLFIPLGARFSAPMILLPVVIVLFTCFTLGLGLIVGPLNTFFRDFGHLITVILQAWYFATPIVYPADNFKSSPWFFWINPAYPFIRIFQTIIRDGQWPSPNLFLAATGLAATSLFVGYVSFKSCEDKLVFRL